MLLLETFSETAPASAEPVQYFRPVPPGGSQGRAGRVHRAPNADGGATPPAGGEPRRTQQIPRRAHEAIVSTRVPVCDLVWYRHSWVWYRQQLAEHSSIRYLRQLL